MYVPKPAACQSHNLIQRLLLWVISFHNIYNVAQNWIIHLGSVPYWRFDYPEGLKITLTIFNWVSNINFHTFNSLCSVRHSLRAILWFTRKDNRRYLWMFVDLLELAQFANNYCCADTSADYKVLSIFRVVFAQQLTVIAHNVQTTTFGIIHCIVQFTTR